MKLTPQPYIGAQLAAPYCNMKSQPLNDEVRANIIIVTTCTTLGQSIEMVKSKSRKREFVEARQIAMSFLKRKTPLSLKKIGSYFNNRDHSTVLSAVQTVSDLTETNFEFRTKVRIIEELINQRI